MLLNFGGDVVDDLLGKFFGNLGGVSIFVVGWRLERSCGIEQVFSVGLGNAEAK
jgi:hypothetical protein